MELRRDDPLARRRRRVTGAVVEVAVGFKRSTRIIREEVFEVFVEEGVECAVGVGKGRV